MRINITEAHLRDLKDSAIIRVGYEPAAFCPGYCCGLTPSCVAPEEIAVRPHFHLVVYGEDPPASPRYHAIFLAPEPGADGASGDRNE